MEQVNYQPAYTENLDGIGVKVTFNTPDESVVNPEEHEADLAQKLREDPTAFPGVAIRDPETGELIGDPERIKEIEELLATAEEESESVGLTGEEVPAGPKDKVTTKLPDVESNPETDAVAKELPKFGEKTAKWTGFVGLGLIGGAIGFVFGRKKKEANDKQE